MMRVIIRKHLAFAVLLFLCVSALLPAAQATVVSVSAEPESSITVEQISTENGDNYVNYPQLSGMENEANQQIINDDIVSSANITQRLITLSIGSAIQVSQTSYLKDQLFSVVISAKGIIDNLRSGHAYTALAFDLTTGSRLQLGDFFADTDAAVAWMEEQLMSGYADELSDYLENTDVTPLPTDSFSFDEYGITFYYPSDQLSLLSGYSGSVQFQYGELQDLLLTGSGSVPVRLGAVFPQYSDMQIQEAIEAIAAEGTLPYVPVRLGDSIPDLITQYRLVREPDQYPSGRYFQLEAPAFRQVFLLSDALTDAYNHSVVEGILATRMNLYGIQTGVTSRDRWHEILGEPATYVALDAYIAADYGLPAGTADYYTIADKRLMLYADESGILYAVRLDQ